jgi:hypothetical protein
LTMTNRSSEELFNSKKYQRHCWFRQIMSPTVFSLVNFKLRKTN